MSDFKRFLHDNVPVNFLPEPARRFLKVQGNFRLHLARSSGIDDIRDISIGTSCLPVWPGMDLIPADASLHAVIQQQLNEEYPRHLGRVLCDEIQLRGNIRLLKAWWLGVGVEHLTIGDDCLPTWPEYVGRNPFARLREKLRDLIVPGWWLQACFNHPGIEDSQSDEVSRNEEDSQQDNNATQTRRVCHTPEAPRCKASQKGGALGYGQATQKSQVPERSGEPETSQHSRNSQGHRETRASHTPQASQDRRTSQASEATLARETPEKREVITDWEEHTQSMIRQKHQANLEECKRVFREKAEAAKKTEAPGSPKATKDTGAPRDHKDRQDGECAQERHERLVCEDRQARGQANKEECKRLIRQRAEAAKNAETARNVAAAKSPEVVNTVEAAKGLETTKKPEPRPDPRARQGPEPAQEWWERLNEKWGDAIWRDRQTNLEEIKLLMRRRTEADTIIEDPTAGEETQTHEDGEDIEDYEDSQDGEGSEESHGSEDSYGNEDDYDDESSEDDKGGEDGNVLEVSQAHGPEARSGGNIDTLRQPCGPLAAPACSPREAPWGLALDQDYNARQVFSEPRNCNPVEDPIAAGSDTFVRSSGDSLPASVENFISPSSQHGSQETDMYAPDSDSDDGYSFVDGDDESDNDLLSLKDFVSQETHPHLKPESTDHIFHDAEMIDADEGKI